MWFFITRTNKIAKPQNICFLSCRTRDRNVWGFSFPKIPTWSSIFDADSSLESSVHTYVSEGGEAINKEVQGNGGLVLDRRAAGALPRRVAVRRLGMGEGASHYHDHKQDGWQQQQQ